MKERIRIEFNSIRDAVQHAKAHGGWIAISDEGIHWYSNYTWSEIAFNTKGNVFVGGYSWIEHNCSNMIGGTLGSR